MKYHEVNIIRKKKVGDNKPIDIKEEQLVCVSTTESGAIMIDGITSSAITVRNGGNLKDRGVWLSDNYEWVITRDDRGELVLVAYRN